MRRLLILALACVILALPAECTEYEFSHTDSVTLYPEEEMMGLYQALPEEAKTEIADFLAAENDGQRADSLKNKLNIGFWLDYVWQKFLSFFKSGTVGFAEMLVVLLLSKIVSSAVLTGEGNSVASVFALASGLICAVSVTRIALKAVDIAVSFIGTICTVMTSMLPVMEAVMLSSGSVTQASINGTSLMIYITLTQNFMKLVLVPLAGALFALSCSSCTFTAVNVSSIVSAVRRILMTVLGFFLLIFSFVLGIQSSLARSADTLAMKTVRFAVGSYIPVVGGALSEALTTVSAGLSLVRRTVGGIGIVIILFTVLPPLISLFVTRLSLLACRSVAEILECTAAEHIISDAEQAVALFCAFAAMTSVFFIFAVILFMNSSPA